jgi:Sugar transferases involved in lipopolysaccharide synthesis
MRLNDNSNEDITSYGDPRITPIGKFMRRTSLDEMPQFFNVLIGNMSVVGPRPHMIKQTDLYEKLIDQFMIRHMIKPGITGWAQISGYRGETKNLEQMEGRFRRDVWYIENWSFILDIKIIIVTIVKVLKGDEQAY